MDALDMYLGEHGRIAVCDNFEEVFIQLEADSDNPVVAVMTIQQAISLRDWLEKWIEENKHLIPPYNPDDDEGIPF